MLADILWYESLNSKGENIHIYIERESIDFKERSNPNVNWCKALVIEFKLVVCSGVI